MLRHVQAYKSYNNVDLYSNNSFEISKNNLYREYFIAFQTNVSMYEN